MLKVIIKTPERCQCYRSGIFLINIELIADHFVVFLLLAL